MEDPDRLLEDLYSAHSLWAARLAYVLTGTRETAEDLVQEAFIRSFDRLGTLRDPAAFPGYLRATILNLRRKAILDWRPGEDLSEIGERDRLWRALQSLPYRQRAALVLRYYEDLSERESADLLGISLPAVKALAARGLESLREGLGDERTHHS